MGMAYAGRWISINSDGETYGVHQHPNLVLTAVIRPALQKNSEWLHLRLVVKGRQMQMFVNGQKIHEEYLPADPDPWLSIVPAGWGASRIRNVKITGNPTVPESLSLSTSHDLRGWLNYHSGEADLAWSKDRSNIVGRRNAHSPASVAYCNTIGRYPKTARSIMSSITIPAACSPTRRWIKWPSWWPPMAFSCNVSRIVRMNLRRRYPQPQRIRISI